jgi:protein dithiol oxidoreductase (disulfide-forming)
MKRRDFSASMALTALGMSLARFSRAQGASPVEGQQYVKLSQPVATPADGKVAVVEFFWYGCPHCNAFEPSLEAWAAKLPSDVDFQRVHVAFSALHETHSKIFYTLQALNWVNQMHRKVFAALHVQHKRLDKASDIEAFIVENGLDGKKFMEVFNSFSVQTKVRQAKQLSDAYKIDGVPTLGIHGRFWTSVGMAGAPERALAVTDYLINRVRHGH